MKKFVILGDSTCDLSRELREKYDIDYIPMCYVEDEEEYLASLDWESHSVKDFYNLMRGGKRVYTNQIIPNVCREKFEAALENGQDVIYISCSSALSSSWNSACVIAKELMEKYPDGHIYCVDSRNSSLGQGEQLIRAAILREQGKTAAETAASAEANRQKMRMIGYPGSLEYLRRAGRVKASSAFFGNLFGVKPILISDRKGQNYALKKVKGFVNARNTVVEMMKESVSEESKVLNIVHADCLEEANALKDQILQHFSFEEIRMANIGPIVGASVGPGTVAVFFYGKEETIEGND